MIVELQHVSKSYKLDGDIFQALKDINFKISESEFVSIVGPSGCGKSTLMHIIGLLDTPTSGDIMIEKNNISHLSDNELSKLRSEFVGFVFQQFNLINKLTVLENILLPTIYSKQTRSDNTHKKAWELMQRFGIDTKANSYPNKLSGGQQQRVAIARALINNPKLILADEPTGNLDSATGKKILALLTELNFRDKITVVIVTHDPQIAKIAQRHIHMIDGIISKR